MDKPNILFILSDQHRHDCVGFDGGCPVLTPNLDRLASEGIWFSHAFTSIPSCCPARQSLLSGKRNELFGALWNYDVTLNIPALEPDEFVWPRVLKSLGYDNAYIGKWHVHPQYDPTAFGFDNYISEHAYYKYRSEKYPDAQLLSEWSDYEDTVLLEDTKAHWLADQAVSIIEGFAEKQNPWHIRLDFSDPHLPCHPIEHFSKLYDADKIPCWASFDEDFIDKPYIQKQQLYNWNVENYTWTDWAPVVARYFGMISQLDHAIGKVIQAIDKLGLADNTIIIYSADHGDMCGAHRMVDKHYVLYDDIVRVPLIIKWPAALPAGVTCDQLVCNTLDIPPTLLDILDQPVPDFFQGKSFLPLMRGKPAADWRDHIVSTFNGNQFGLYTSRMIRDKKWKYIWNTTDTDELYNLESDPAELTNLIHDKQCKSVLSEKRKALYFELVRNEDGLFRHRCWLENSLLNGRKV